MSRRLLFLVRLVGPDLPKFRNTVFNIFYVDSQQVSSIIYNNWIFSKSTSLTKVKRVIVEISTLWTWDGRSPNSGSSGLREKERKNVYFPLATLKAKRSQGSGRVTKLAFRERKRRIPKSLLLPSCKRA